MPTLAPSWAKAGARQADALAAAGNQYDFILKFL